MDEWWSKKEKQQDREAFGGHNIKRLRLLNYFREICPAWVLTRQARIIERAFASDLMKAKDWVARESIARQCESEASEYWEALAELRSRRLINRAHRLYVSTEGVEWITGNYAHRYLDNQSQTRLHKLVIEENRKTWEFRLKIIGATIGVLTGLVGTIIGLVAVWKK